MTNYKKNLRVWRQRHHPGETEMESLKECARRAGISTRQWQRYESDTPAMNHGQLRVYPVPLWLRHYVDANKPLPEPKK